MIYGLGDKKELIDNLIKKCLKTYECVIVDANSNRFDVNSVLDDLLPLNVKEGTKKPRVTSKLNDLDFRELFKDKHRALIINNIDNSELIYNEYFMALLTKLNESETCILIGTATQTALPPIVNILSNKVTFYYMRHSNLDSFASSMALSSIGDENMDDNLEDHSVKAIIATYNAGTENSKKWFALLLREFVKSKFKSIMLDYIFTKASEQFICSSKSIMESTAKEYLDHGILKTEKNKSGNVYYKLLPKTSVIVGFMEELRINNNAEDSDNEDEYFQFMTGQPLSIISTKQSNDWQNYKKQFNKLYTNQSEEFIHQEQFFKNLKLIDAHNQKFKKNETSFELGLNDVSDMLPSYSKVFDTDELTKGMNELPLQDPISSTQQIIPDSLNWTALGRVSGVINQWECGCCYIASPIQCYEGYMAKKSGILLSYSVQSVLDCWSEGTCDGGIMPLTFDYIKNNYIPPASNYSYLGYKDTCEYDIPKKNSTFKTMRVQSGNETALKIAVATYGPVSVSIYSRLQSFQMYKSGVYYDPNCYGHVVDHSVLITGYGVDPVYGKYWIVKNSWGTNYGDQGYIKMARERNNICGIASWAAFIAD
uniref:Origin recognition complex subunit 2 n=1 Tax=Rhabditophanes sp. KR3021 TaxID=114890 RepID=A0AC35TMD8_9BILA